MPTLQDYLILSAILFSIGTAGVFVRRNLITILLSIEIMLNAVNLTFVAFGRAMGSADGQIIVFFVMTVAAAEAAVGLAIVIALYRHRESLNPDMLTQLKWYRGSRTPAEAAEKSWPGVPGGLRGSSMWLRHVAADSVAPVPRVPAERQPGAANQQSPCRSCRMRGDRLVVRRVARRGLPPAGARAGG